ncbi:sigma-54-dependent Fis family transcriptional regulator [Methylococcus sp. EFPC2]|uniref:sigma-54 interaction domain-containing protein n=1 Tax=Methylococcus sp. EFPC2 TaxID=2812648 RepID=UPI00196889A8|nr:sigma-54 dependent transcriptional regulator [Methylococcus sp. EFPC2]QSA96507.1 sigma-54-dependent Fis family transcriptional regulator [Methylococcus sp. EFPC2]
MEINSADIEAKSSAGADQSTVLTFSQPRSMTLSVRASALVFEDNVSRRLLDQIQRIAPSDATVLITGETGTGKELVARQIHAMSRRSGERFGAVNCTALSETLIESELFGHEKGAFTGAVESKVGWFETANHGTLFLDEVGDMPLGLQAKLLRVLQEREVVRVGARKATPVDVRVVAATNVNLEDAVEAGHFRPDLYYRFNVAAIHLTPLRERPGDILPLANHFLEVYGSRLGYSATLSPDTVRLLLSYDWPGNIRELENAIHRALLICPSSQLRPQDFKLSGLRPQVAAAPPSTPTLETALRVLFDAAPPKLFEIIEETVIRSAYEYCDRNQVQTARLLDISRNILRHRMATYEITRSPKNHPRYQEPGVRYYWPNGEAPALQE